MGDLRRKSITGRTPLGGKTYKKKQKSTKMVRGGWVLKPATTEKSSIGVLGVAHRESLFF